MAASFLPTHVSKEEARIRNRLRVGDRQLRVDVNRIDYIKGLPERFHPVNRLLTLHPDTAGPA